ncbi:peptidyl-prolyl cis-trans isomerase sig-7 [Sabethes cyaneus]|uniref:peptidyl-prolyl cis-trans isomerase sig-7 n=1 Tax=Sabethes cyaneus TaxID=53552 RepID=UPI00237E1D42|nr:peptidyl-prolyl cis-trans isomerase sig-7 [Sabethes cyaneus]
MSVVIETTIGDITVDLFLTERPRAALNFLKLCKLKYYNFNLFHTIQHGFIAQTGDPGGSGDGGSSIWGVLEGKHKRYFEGEAVPKIKHTEPGLLSMVCAGEGLIGSQFFFTLGPDLASLDSGGHVVVGEVTEGHEVLRKLNEVICDEKNRPYQDVRITHTVVLEDPFDDPRGFKEPSRSPSPSSERLAGGRIAADEEIDDTEGKTAEEVAEMLAEKEAKARATILEIVGDIPDAEIAPPENVLFVCKLNPVTTDDDLQIIFSRFGKIKGCEVIRDKISGDSLQYAFIEFEDKKACEDAYFKMDNVLIDDRRIHVDFSQSVSKVRWKGKGKGIEYFDGTDSKSFKDIQYNATRSDRKRAPSRLRKSASSGSSSGSRSPNSKPRNRSPRGLRGGGGGAPRGRSPWRRSGGGGNEGRRRDNRVRLSESNSAYHEERNGRDIRVVQGMVDYKNRPYPPSFIKRNAPKQEDVPSRQPPPRGRRSRSPIRNRQLHRSNSRDRRRVSRSRSSSYRRNPSSDQGRRGRDRDRRRISRSPLESRNRRRASASRSPDRKAPRSSRRSFSPDQRSRVDRDRNRRNVSPPARRRPSPKSRDTSSFAVRDERKKAKKKRHSSNSDRSSDASSDDRSKSKKKRKNSKKKIKKSDKKYSSSASSDSDSDSSDDGGKRKKKKNKSKKKRK